MEVIKDPKALIRAIHAKIDANILIERARELWERAKGQTFDDCASEVEYVKELLTKEGFTPEVMTFPADGRTVYQDMRTPLGWRASVGRLTVVDSPIAFSDPVIADYEKMSYHLIKHSVATPKEGLRVRIVTEAQAFAGEDVRGALVLLESNHETRKNAIPPLLDLGAIGVVTDFLPGAVDTPDALHWVNAGTDGNGQWHSQCEDRDFIGFVVTPRVGKQLREAINEGRVEALAECDGERYESEIYAVNAVMKGKSEKELWLMAHIYEPLLTDNATGAVANIYLLKAIRELVEEGVIPEPEYSVRLVFAMELYGYVAVMERLGVTPAYGAIGGINNDAGAYSKDKCRRLLKIQQAPVGCRSVCNYISEAGALVVEEALNIDLPLVNCYSGIADDVITSDNMMGIPAIWYKQSVSDPRHSRWHSTERNENFISAPHYAAHTALVGLYVARMITLNEDTVRAMLPEMLGIARERLARECEIANGFPDARGRMEYFLNAEKEQMLAFCRFADIPEVKAAAASLKLPEGCAMKDEACEDGPWKEYAKTIVASRKQRGIPYDLVRVERENRRPMPDRMIYGAFSTIISNMDGKKSLEQLIREGMWEFHRGITDREYKVYIDAVHYLSEYGYLSVEGGADITKDDVKAALEKLGIEKGDVLVFHSALSGCGRMQGGADALIDAVVETVGESGTVMAPAFTNPYIAFDGMLNKNKLYRPYSPDDLGSIWTGRVPKRMLEREGFVRSEHATHSFVGRGARIAECFAEQRLLDPPVAKSSPVVKAMELGGKAVFYGCGVSSNTFIHHLEHEADSVFLENAVVKVKDKEQRLRTEVIHKHLPGCRDFYHHRRPTSKFYLRAIERGLEIKEARLGTDYVYAMDLGELYRIGTQLFLEDPDITLCDREDCYFCKRYRKRK